MEDFQHFSLDDWIEFIQGQHWRSIDLQLDRVREVWTALGGHTCGLVIAVGGTNGKGSCVAMLEAAFLAAGLNTGCYTSPHLVRYNERVRLNGEPAQDHELCRAFAEIEQARQGIPLTYFEFGTLCALRIFQQRNVDVSILEVGMGGRLDAVNMVDNDIALITAIGIDHAEWLGEDRESIAAEKAGIFRRHGRAVCADIDPPKSIGRIATERHCRIVQGGIDYQVGMQSGSIAWSSAHPDIPAEWRHLEGLTVPWGGRRQAGNLGGVIAVLALTAEDTGVSPDHLVRGLEYAVNPGRCQRVSSAPLVILDVAHNADALDELAGFLQRHPVAGRTRAVLGMLADKPVAPVVDSLEHEVDEWYLATLQGDRGQESEKLAQALSQAGCSSPMYPFSGPVDAYRAARRDLDDIDRLVIFGSFHTVGDIIAYLEFEGE